MAIYHLSVKIISRGKGKSAIAAAAYRSASKLKDKVQNTEFDYSNKHGVEYSEIIAPENAPEWVKDRQTLWDKVEEAETRINSQVAREVEVAIPVELNNNQAINLVTEFVKQQFVTCGMVADLNIHRDNPENPHAHILLTTRNISENGFTVKERSWNNKAKICEWRSAWAELANHHLREAGFEITIDHRSYKDQGLEIKPTFHLGYKLYEAWEMGKVDEYQALQDYHAIIEENAVRIIQNPQIALDVLTAQKSVFSDIDIAKFANRNSNTTEQYYQVVSAIKTHALQIATTEQGRVIYTSKEMLELEETLVNTASELSVTNMHWVPEKYKNQALNTSWWEKFIGKTKITLNESQLRCLNHILESGNLKMIIGHAGTGKTTLLGIAKDAWEANGYRVLGTSLSGIAAQNLQESGIQSRTVDSLLLSLDKGTLELNSNDVIVVDEAGMVDSRRLTEILVQAQAAAAKVVMLGDPEQLQPIQAGAPFRTIAERIGYSTLDEIVRQFVDNDSELTSKMRQASKDFATNDTIAGLICYEQLGCVYSHATKQDAIDAIISAWNNGRKPGVTQIMLAYTRKDVAELNDKARAILNSNHVLKNSHILQVKNRDNECLCKSFAVNERIYFIKNDSSLGVKNGSLGRIEKINGNNLVVLLDTGNTISFDLKDYAYIDYGYAATTHKSQGVTVDRTYFLADKYLDRHATYVAATRHRSHLEIHYDTETFKSQQDFYRIVSRERLKDMVLDYTQNRGLVTEKTDSAVVNSSINVQDAVSYKETDYKKYDIAHIKHDLAAQAEEVAAHYLGSPKERHRSYLRYGSNHGSLVLTTKGTKQGSWYDFQTGNGGDMLSLISYVTNCADFKKVLEEATQFLGGHSLYRTFDDNFGNASQVIEDQHVQEKIAIAQKIAAESQPIAGTLAEQYLRQHRGIKEADFGENLRFHPNLKHPFTHEYYPALIAIAKDSEQQICAVQATYLDSGTATKAQIDQVKITRGSLSSRQCGVLINKGVGDTIYLAEGIETALSIKEAQPDKTIYATLGIANFAHVPILENTRKIIFCADNDGKEAASQKMLTKAAEQLMQRNVDVWLSMPEKEKQDFNDVLKLRGVEEVRLLLSKAVTYKELIQALELGPVDETIKVKEIFKVFIDKQLQLQELATLKLINMVNNPELAAQYSSQAIAVNKELIVLSSQAMKNTIIKQQVENYCKGVDRHSRLTVDECGGFAALQERLGQGRLTANDTNALYGSLYSKFYGLNKTHKLEQERNIGD